MKKPYLKPEIEIKSFMAENIVTQSGISSDAYQALTDAGISVNNITTVDDILNFR
ncbi:MAG TPA: hypothetical protein IAA60_08855 [Candidatus Ornithomonoglobus intestinigallinarum]|uniref:Uncharacterized protein n=1 Tax=Candidatus Ornithomonoglobus intestinigallinarum TaxID=2840894 RepID=A0A9D1H4H4_9FIRM|nr:hypothetical protein [Candidatus Ornithomonoglobus intestinigallinarum]